MGITDGLVCGVCNMNLPRTGFGSNITDNPMARIFFGKLPIERCVALVFFVSHSKTSQIVYDLKYHGRYDIGDVMGRLLVSEFEPTGFFEGIDVIVPMPLTRSRKRSRGYNQSAEIAKGIGRACHIPVDTKAVRRMFFNGSQTTKKFFERAGNVAGAFKLVSPERVHGKHVLIVDDVVTSGSSVSECAKALLAAGDVRVSIMSFAFTKR